MDKQIKNIVFDFGGVLMDLDFENCLDGFRTAGFKDVDQYTSVYQGESFFKDFETGMISADQFRQKIKSRIDQPLTDEEVDALWLRMLKYIPAEKIDLLLELRQHYMVYLLSNTNEIHWQYVSTLKYGRRRFRIRDFFEQMFLSFEMKMAKPDTRIFERMMHEANILPEETLFIDDSAANCHAAASLGIHAHHYHVGDDLSLIFK
jgi:putative hydrolase of the HAD superfamily